MRGACVLGFALLTACAGRARPGAPSATPTSRDEGARFPAFPERPRASAGDAFVRAWSDGQAELSGYRARVSRYGALRDAEVVLVFVTEPMDRRTWIKDDHAPAAQRVNVMKLNASLKFQTGVYPYSVLTSVFAPIDRYRDEAFSPVKITLSVQEWCGHVFHGVWPGEGTAVEQMISYFAEEGERRGDLTVPAGALYEDALLIQLRELDGPFAHGAAWHGPLVPALWNVRRAHTPLRAVDATITRARESVDGVAVNRFTVRWEGGSRDIDVEVDGAHRVMGWRSSDGEEAHLLRTARMPYWQLNHPGDETHRALFGL